MRKARITSVEKLSRRYARAFMFVVSCAATAILLSTTDRDATAQVTLVQESFPNVSVPFNAPNGDSYPFLISEPGNIKQLWWGFGSSGWRDLHIRYTSPTGESFEQVAGDPWVSIDHMTGVESAGTWNLNLLETVPGPAHNLSTDITLVTQRHANPNLPVTGLSVPELDGLDDVVVDFLRAYGLEAATVAVVKDGRLVFEHGYGWQDRGRTTPIRPDSVMRLATNSVMITARALHQLAEDGRLDFDEKVFDVVNSPPHPAFPIVDARVLDITIGQIADHTSGLVDNAPSPRDTGQILGLGRSATLDETIAYMWSKSLLFAPGTSSAFSHYAMQLAGKLIEVKSGMSYPDYIHFVVGLSGGMPTFHEARSSAAEARPNEIWYAGEWYSHHDDDFFFSGPLLRQPEAIDFTSRPGAGSLMSSARDAARFLTKFYHTGPRKPATGSAGPWGYALYGSLAGTTTVTTDTISPTGSSVSFTALVNERVDGQPLNEELHATVDDFLDDVSVWPDHDLFGPALELDPDSFRSKCAPGTTATLEIEDVEVPPGSDRLLVVSIGGERNPGDCDPASAEVEFNGMPMVFRAQGKTSETTPFVACAGIYTLAVTGDETGNVTITWPDDVGNAHAAAMVILNASDDVRFAFGNGDFPDAGETSIENHLTVAKAGSLVIDIFNETDAVTLEPGPEQFLSWSEGCPGMSAGGSLRDAPRAGPLSMEWSTGVSTARYAHAAIVVEPLPSPFECALALPADCNRQAGIDAGDPICTVGCLISNPPPGADCSCAADCNCLGGVEASDPVCAVLRLVGSYAPDTCGNVETTELLREDSPTISIKSARGSQTNGGGIRFPVRLRGRDAGMVASMALTVRTQSPESTSVRLSRRLRRTGFSIRSDRRPDGSFRVLITPPASLPIRPAGKGRLLTVASGTDAGNIKIEKIELGSREGTPIRL